ncbi:hypothetical protein TNCV_2286251 [Trichonephila clavipes]|nr:hypothetical protein TNCV_2286251 [Trichonephila clavipes]
MTEYLHLQSGKTGSANQNGGQKEKLNEKDQREHLDSNQRAHDHSGLLRFQEISLRIFDEISGYFPVFGIPKFPSPLKLFPIGGCGHGSLVVKILDHGRHVMSSSPVPLKTHRIGDVQSVHVQCVQCKFNLSRAQMSSRWCDVVVRRCGASSVVVHVI